MHIITFMEAMPHLQIQTFLLFFTFTGCVFRFGYFAVSTRIRNDKQDKGIVSQFQ